MTIPDNQPPSPNPSPNPAPANSFTPGAGFQAAGFKADSAVVSPQAPTATSPANPFPSAEKPKEKTSKGVIVAGVLILTLAGLVAGFGKIRTFVSNAQGSCEPESIAESNLTTSSVEIIFQTGKACQMEVAYGTNRGALLLQVPEAMASLNHRIKLTPLLASTTYYYQVVYAGKKLGTVRSFLTKPAAPSVTPTVVPIVEEGTQTIPTTVPATGSASTKYSLQDFQTHFGSSSAEFDLDKNGVVNNADWLLYQKTQ